MRIILLKIIWQQKIKNDCGTRYIFHKSPHFLGECGGKLFEGKGIKRVGLGFDNLMYLVPIPQKNTFSMEVWMRELLFFLCFL